MSRSGASLVKIWEYEGQPSSATSKSASEIKITNSSAVKAELIRYYQKHGMEHMAKEVGIIHSNGDANTAKNQMQIGPRKVITLPVHTKSQMVNMSPFKMEQAVLPKSVHISNSPMILSTPQRVVANVISSPRTPQSLLSPSSDLSSWSGKRPYSMGDSDYSDGKRCKKGEKGGKGLRHFSMKVCEKVRRKGTTSYNEVADELVAEFTDPLRNICPTEQAYDQKNIRRRVYDALNVLMAMSIISKEKKEIKWLGLPTNSAQEYQNLENEKTRRIERIRAKTQRVQELILQQIAFKNLVEKNKLAERKNGRPTCKIRLPFVVINTDKRTIVECSISGNKSEFMFNFNDTFRISDDIEIMKRMGMVLNLDAGTASDDDVEKAKKLVPKALQPYVIQMAHGMCEYPPGMTSDGKCIKTESDLYSEPTSDFQEASSSSMIGSDFIAGEIALESSHTGLSRQSSVGSLSDLPSRQEASTPSDYSDSDPDSSGEDEI